MLAQQARIRQTNDNKQVSGTPPSPDLNVISDEDFQAFRKLIYTRAGISLNEGKRMLVCSRLSKRLRHLNLSSYREYYKYLQRKGQDEEMQQMINCMTTNKTDFFREPHHFDYLKEVVLPQIEERCATAGKRRIRIWCTASSKGHEPYSLAITLADYFGNPRGWDLRILASDIDTDVLAEAQNGVYPAEEVAPVPEPLKRRFFLRGTGEQRGKVRVRPGLQELVVFRQINLVSDPWPVQTRFDVIFCRNVIIYFDGSTQQRLIQRLADYLVPDGHLMLGHSENMPWSESRFEPLGNTIYRLR